MSTALRIRPPQNPASRTLEIGGLDIARGSRNIAHGCVRRLSDGAATRHGNSVPMVSQRKSTKARTRRGGATAALKSRLMFAGAGAHSANTRTSRPSATSFATRKVGSVPIPQSASTTVFTASGSFISTMGTHRTDCTLRCRMRSSRLSLAGGRSSMRSCFDRSTGSSIGRRPFRYRGVATSQKSICPKRRTPSLGSTIGPSRMAISA